jgi:hypothetical protein
MDEGKMGIKKTVKTTEVRKTTFHLIPSRKNFLTDMFMSGKLGFSKLRKSAVKNKY